MIKSFLQEFGLLHHHIESYNDMIKNKLLYLDGYTFNIEYKEVKWSITFKNPKLYPPENPNTKDIVYPTEILKMNGTYSSDLYLDVVIRINDITNEDIVRGFAKENNMEYLSDKISLKELLNNILKKNKEKLKEYASNNLIESIHNVCIAKIPVMVMSDICNISKYKNDCIKLASINEDIYEQGGYFIINGKKKILITQENSIRNDDTYLFDMKSNHNYNFIQIWSDKQINMRSSKTNIMRMNDRYYSTIPYLQDSDPVPISILLKALTFETDEEVYNMLMYNSDISIKEELIKTYEEGLSIKTTDEALSIIGKLGKKFIRGDKSKEFEDSVAYGNYILINEFLPHLGKDLKKKGFYICKCVRNLVDI